MTKYQNDHGERTLPACLRRLAIWRRGLKPLSFPNDRLFPASKRGYKPLLHSCACIALSLVSQSLHAEPSEKVPEPLPERVETFTIKTRSELNREIPFYLRVPKNYQPGKMHRLLFLCPYLNQEGLAKLKQSEKWLELADERGWFVMSCTFKQEAKNARDRKLAYYYPEGFSGKATVDALELAAKKYSLDPERLLMQGISGGAQFVHRFALWAPDRVTAVAVNSSSWFDPPDAKSARVAWLLTIGDSDESFDETLAMVENLRKAGAAPLFQSFIGVAHEITGNADPLSVEFLKFHDERTRSELGKKRSTLTPPEQRLAMKAEEMPYVGDSQDWKFWPNTPEAREAIPEDSLIYIPSETIAKLWGTPEEME